MSAIVKRRVVRSGINIGGHHYGSPHLTDGTSVWARLDPNQLGRALILSEDRSEYFCAAICPELSGTALPRPADLAREHGQDHTAADIVAKIAQIATAVGFQANEPAMEVAGQIVSILAANPEHIDRFMASGTELFLDGTFNHENGSLTYRAMNGSILSPSVLREKKGQQQ